MNDKDAFKLGFTTVLAENNVSPEDLVDSACITKEAMDKTAILGQVFAPATALALFGLPAMALLGGSMAGGAGGQALAQATDVDVDDLEMMRKQHLLTKLKQLRGKRRVDLSNKLLTQARKEPDEEEEL